MAPVGKPAWPEPARRTPGWPPAQVDAAVIGAGITGTCLARRLARDGLSVAVLERRGLGSGASGRNAGFLLAGVAACYAEAVEQYGRTVAGEVWAFTLETHRRLAGYLAGVEVGYEQRGSWVLPAGTAEAERLAESATLMEEDRLPGRWDAAQPPVAGGPGGGLFSPEDGSLDPSRMLVALAQALPEGTIFEDHEVIGLEPAGSGVRVHFARGELTASRVVVATNGYTHRLLPKLPIAPVRAQMLAAADPGWRLASLPVYSDRGYRYWRQLTDGSVLLGGFRNTDFEAEVGDDDCVSASVQGALQGFLGVLGVASAVTHRWAGTMGFTPDQLPVVGEVDGLPGVWVCGGYSGHGLGFAALAVERLVDAWSGRPLPSWLDLGRFAAATPVSA